MSKKILAVFLFFLIFFTGTAFADKTSVTIDAQDTVKKGSEITIKVNVTHKGNNFVHYTNWVYLKANGKEIARWEFSMGNRPEDEKFAIEINNTDTEPTEIISEGNCNLHGTKGPAVLKINVK